MIEPPVISELVPHAGRMLLLGRLLDSGADYVTCEVLVRADGMFDRDGRVPAWLGVEESENANPLSGAGRWAKR